MNKIGKAISITRWVTRICGILVVLLFLVFFIGETDFTKPFNLSLVETFLIFFIPILLSIGIIIAFRKEILGGVIITVSVIAFNIILIAHDRFSWELDFGWFLILGFLFIVCGILEKHK